MRLPRDISADELVTLLRRYEYRETRQTGSHIRLTTFLNGEHHITIPRHKHLRIGTFHSILRDIADHLALGLDKIAEDLFSRNS